MAHHTGFCIASVVTRWSSTGGDWVAGGRHPQVEDALPSEAEIVKTSAMDAQPKKYELIRNERMTLANGTVVYRIRALKDFRGIKAGTLGGWVQSDANLSQVGTCWLSEGAMAIDDARVSEDAFVARLGRESEFFHDDHIGFTVISHNPRVGEHGFKKLFC